MNPVGGSAPRLANRSMCEYARPIWWEAQKMPGSSRSIASWASMFSGRSQPHASMPIVEIPWSTSHAVASGVTPGPRTM